MSDEFYTEYRAYMERSGVEAVERTAASGRLSDWERRVILNAAKPVTREVLVRMVQDMPPSQRRTFAEMVFGEIRFPSPAK